MTEKLIAYGGALKATDIDANTGRIEGYLIYFTDAARRDLHGEYFTAETDLYVAPDAMKGLPVFYQHGYDDTLELTQLAAFDEVEVDKVGVWVAAQMGLHDEWERAVYEMVKKGILRWSSGALPQSVRTSKDGEILKWRVIEGSLTPTPAAPHGTVIRAKAFERLVKEAGEPPERHAPDPQAAVPPHSTEAAPLNRKMKMTIQELSEAILDLLREAGMSDTEAPAVAEAMRAEADAMTDEEKAAATADEDSEKKQKAHERLMLAALQKRSALKMKHTDYLKTRMSAVQGQMAAAPAVSVTQTVGVKTGGRITNVEDLRYAHLSASDMAIGAMLCGPSAHAVAGDSYLRVLAHKAAEATQDTSLPPKMRSAIKASLPFKADELNASNIPTQGLEWVGDVWSATLWKRERLDTIYERLVAKGMMVIEVAQGSDGTYVPVEGADPTVFAAPQANSVDVTGRPEATVPITPFITGSVPLVPQELKAATSFTDVLDEDSIIRIAPFVNQSLTDAMLEARDKLLINGDTATTANTNINFIDGTPAGGIQRPYYTAANGFRKLPLVTAPSRARDGGTLTYQDFVATRDLLDRELRPRTNRMVFLITPEVESLAVMLPELLTYNARGDRATVNTGALGELLRTEVITWGYMPMTNAQGRVEQLTPGNNTKGTILLIYAPYWAVGYKRQIGIESARDILSGSTIVVASMRMGIVARGANAAAMSYNLS